VIETDFQRHLVDGVGLWREVLRPPPVGPALPALFLDRDGVIVAETGYLHQPPKVALIPGATALIAACNRSGVPVLAVTNQSGVGRGLYGWADFVAVQTRMIALIEQDGGALDGVLACAYHADAQGAYAVADHGWRKPRPGMLLAAAEVWPIDLARSWIAGDCAGDLAAGKAAGLAGGLHVLTGHGAADRVAATALAEDDFQVLLADSVADHGALLRGLGVA
jgi:D-glycero-D-manno-heptose 1,7-bisphosphate phosphatase